MENNQFYKNILNSINEGIYFVDDKRGITFWNKGAEHITGFTASEVVGHFCYNNILNHVDENGKRLCMSGCPLHRTLTDGIERDSKIYLHHKEGHRVPVKVHVSTIEEDGKIIGAVETFVRADSEFNNEFQIDELKMLAYQDQLTELPNRRYLDQQLENHIRLNENEVHKVALAFVDIDHFKHINDHYGHNIGDDVLKMIAKTMKSGTRHTDIVGRWGGEEFIVIFNHMNELALPRVCEKIRMLVEASGLRLEQEEIKVTISIGATLILKGDTAKSLVQRADELLYESKTCGRNRVTIR